MEYFYDLIEDVTISSDREKYYMYGGYTPIGRDCIEISKETFEYLIKDFKKITQEGIRYDRLYSNKGNDNITKNNYKIK